MKSSMSISVYPWAARPIFILLLLLSLSACRSGSSSHDGGGVNPEEEGGLQAGIVSPADPAVTVYKDTELTFEGSASGGSGIYTYSWDFDGAASNIRVQNPGKILFSTVKTYTITLTVTDFNGDTSTDTVTVTVLSSSDMSKVNADLIAFMNDPTDASYNVVMNDLDNLDSSTGSNFYRAFAELLDIYRDPLPAELMAGFGLTSPIGLDTDFEALQDMNDFNDMTCRYLKLLLMYEDAEDVLLELRTRLENVDSLLAQTQGIRLRVYTSDVNYVNIDDIDVNVIRSFTSLFRAFILYLQAVDFDITEYAVTYNGIPCDIRELLTEQNGAPLRIEDDDEIMDATLMQLLADNTNLLTYKYPARLADFRAAFSDAAAHYSDAVTALEALTSEQIRQRYINAFNYDSTVDIEVAKITRDNTLPGILSCMNNTASSFQVARTEGTSHKYIDGNDGFYYREKTYNIYRDTVEHKDSVSTVTLYNLLNTGTKTPRGTIYEQQEIQNDNIDNDGDGPVDNDDDAEYEIYYVPTESNEIIMTRSAVEWDNPYVRYGSYYYEAD